MKMRYEKMEGFFNLWKLRCDSFALYQFEHDTDLLLEVGKSIMNFKAKLVFKRVQGDGDFFRCAVTVKAVAKDGRFVFSRLHTAFINSINRGLTSRETVLRVQ